MGFRGITYLSLKAQNFVMKRFLLSFLLVSLFLAQGVLAEDFSITVQQNPDYYASMEDYITVTIYNPMFEDWFTTSIFGFPQEWADAEETLLRVPGAGFGTVNIKIFPSKDALPGIYQYFLKITRPSTDSVVEKPILLNVKQVTSAIIKDVSLSCLSCLEKVDVTGSVYNVGSQKVDVALVVKVGNVQKTIDIGKIAITDHRDFELSFPLEDVEPKGYEVELTLVDASGNVLYEESHPFEIPAIEDVYYHRDVSSTPFGSIITLSADNRGNVVADVQLTSESPEDWYYIMSGPTPSGMFLENYAWTANLMPGDSFAITYSEIYWPIYVLIVAIVVVVSIVYWQTSDIDFSKDVMTAKKFKPGQQLSVSLHLKNKKEDLKRVTIRDLVPAGFSIVNKFEASKPLIRKVGSGIELFWDVGRLDPYEERFFHYTIKPSTTTVTKSSLPSALVKAMRGRKFFSKRTNAVSVGPEELETTVVTVQVAK